MTGAKAAKGARSAAPFWKRKTLDEMTRAEWESLCDGCAKCCLVKLEDEDTGKLFYTDAACRLLDSQTCRCTDYRNRSRLVPDCVTLTPARLRKIDWLPPSCAYRLLSEGKDLPSWHPLVSGDPETVHRAKMSVRGRATSEDDIPFEDILDHVVAWPKRVAK